MIDKTLKALVWFASRDECAQQIQALKPGEEVYVDVPISTVTVCWTKMSDDVYKCRAILAPYFRGEIASTETLSTSMVGRNISFITDVDRRDL